MLPEHGAAGGARTAASSHGPEAKIGAVLSVISLGRRGTAWRRQSRVTVAAREEFVSFREAARTAATTGRLSCLKEYNFVLPGTLFCLETDLLPL